MELPPPPLDYEKRVPRCEEATNLVQVGVSVLGRELLLAPDVAENWQVLCSEGARAGVRLILISGFRSVERQTEIVKKKLEAGQTLEAILRLNAYPGFSEHHSGRAVDVGSPDCTHLTEAFENTREFAWLNTYGARFGFFLSYPRNHPSGIQYEPWHWLNRVAVSAEPLASARRSHGAARAEKITE